MSSFVALAFLAFLLPHVTNAQCVTEGFKVDITTKCSFDALLKAFTPIFDDPINKSPGCTSNSAETDLIKLLTNGGSSKTAAINAVQTFCAEGLASYSETVPFHKIPGYGEDFVAKFFNGGTEWNTMRSTEHPRKADGTPSHLLKEEASQIPRFYEEKGQHGLVQWPDHVPNFSQCQMNTAYCCWTSDRQAGDNNGNCKEPYDENCVDADPGDNTDLCYVDIADGAATLGNSDTGMFFFPQDDLNNEARAEGPMHCHGFGWADDVLDPSTIYKGNNLFYISFYDHLFKRGYVRNVPGSPMCGCAEQMPVVTRADCTQMEVVQAFEITYDGASFSATVTKIDITFQACKGVDRYGKDDPNDLWSHMNRLYMAGNITSQKLLDLNTKLVGDEPNMCQAAMNKHMAAKGYAVGHSSSWVQLAGREALSLATPVGKTAFTTLYNSSSSKIMKRVCPNCYISHRTLFYKRKTPIPSDFDLLASLLYSTEKKVGNQWGVDFEIYSTIESAMAGKDAWTCPSAGYNYLDGFPGNCGPNGETKGQESRFNQGYWGGKQDTAWYLDTSSPFKTLSSIVVGDPPQWVAPTVTASIAEANGKIYMTTNAVDLHGKRDNFQFWATEYSADVEVIVRLETFEKLADWSKTGIIIRDSANDPSCKYFSLLVSGSNGIYSQWRLVEGEDQRSNGKVWDNSLPFKSPVWLRVLKQGSLFTAYQSTDGVNWTMRTSQEVLMSGSVYAGLGLSANHWSQNVAEAVYTDFDATVYVWPSAAPSTTASPTTYNVPISKIGNPNGSMPGKASVDSSGRNYVVSSVGNFGGFLDGFYFASLPHNGDFSVRGYIKSFTTTSEWSSTAIMIRDAGLDGKAVHASCVLQLSNGVYMSARQTYGGDTKSHAVRWGSKQSSGWCRLDKVGNVVTGYRSFDGMNWEEMQTVTVNFGSATEVGIAASGKWNEYGTVEIENFEIV